MTPEPQGDPHEALAKRLQELLRDSEPVDELTAARLSAARRRALDSRQRGPRLSWLWAPGGAVAAAVVAGILLRGVADPEAPVTPTAIAPAEVIDMLNEEVDPEFYEDLEMYRWLAGGDGHA
jgi:hypothetical protein